jgi:hypothetical protein
MQPARQRISDDERQQVAEVLHDAAAQGRISLDELGQRLTLASTAKTYADLAPVTADLPAVSGAVLPLPLSADVAPAPVFDSSFASMSTKRREGRWRLGSRHRALALWGGVVLDLREALVTSPVVTLQASAFMGSVDVIVDEHTVVLCDGHAFMGDFSEKRSHFRSEPQHGSLVVRVQGRALMGRVTIKRKPSRAPQ